jgi:hypothetical protein
MAEDSSSFEQPKSNVGLYKAIIAIGVMGGEDDVTRFIALWIADSERRAHRINDKLFQGRLQLLPLPEGNDEIPQ